MFNLVRVSGDAHESVWRFTKDTAEIFKAGANVFFNISEEGYVEDGLARLQAVYDCDLKDVGASHVCYVDGQYHVAKAGLYVDCKTTDDELFERASKGQKVKRTGYDYYSYNIRARLKLPENSCFFLDKKGFLCHDVYYGKKRERIKQGVSRSNIKRGRVPIAPLYKLANAASSLLLKRKDMAYWSDIRWSYGQGRNTIIGNVVFYYRLVAETPHLNKLRRTPEWRGAIETCLPYCASLSKLLSEQKLDNTDSPKLRGFVRMLRTEAKALKLPPPPRLPKGKVKNGKAHQEPALQPS